MARVTSSGALGGEDGDGAAAGFRSPRARGSTGRGRRERPSSEEREGSGLEGSGLSGGVEGGEVDGDEEAEQGLARSGGPVSASGRPVRTRKPSSKVLESLGADEADGARHPRAGGADKAPAAAGGLGLGEPGAAGRVRHADDGAADLLSTEVLTRVPPVRTRGPGGARGAGGGGAALVGRRAAEAVSPSGPGQRDPAEALGAAADEDGLEEGFPQRAPEAGPAQAPAPRAERPQRGRAGGKRQGQAHAAAAAEADGGPSGSERRPPKPRTRPRKSPPERFSLMWDAAGEAHAAAGVASADGAGAGGRGAADGAAGPSQAGSAAADMHAVEASLRRCLGRCGPHTQPGHGAWPTCQGRLDTRRAS